MKLLSLDGQEAGIPAEAIQAFRLAFKGQVVLPDDPAYDGLRKIWNAMIDRRPGVILRCLGTTDVITAVKFVAAHGLLSSVRSGGHNIAGLAVCEGGVMIDLSLMRGVFVDTERRVAHAQAGCTLGDVDRETQLHGLATVMGFVSDTGIAGLTVGGGFGYLTRRYGWTCDNVVAMNVVSAEGKLLRASADENPELFWALRGGGGNFGIVTSFDYRLYAVGPTILGGALAWRGEDARRILAAYREISARAPRDLTCVAILRKAPPAPWLPKEVHGQPIVALFLTHCGAEADDSLINELRAVMPPIADTVTRRPYAQMQSLLDATQPRGRRYYWKSHYLARIDDGLIDVLATRLKDIPSPHSGIILFQIGGALNELPPAHSPAGNRDATYVLNISSSWERAEDDTVNRDWARECFAAAQTFATGGTYLNFLTEEDGGARIADAYGPENLRRLAGLKRKLDPANLFRHTKAVI
ncbi:FAD-binding oxidoreductase [Usitatibacter palustris]|uniref:6-hydroxy-D-nicotine oxidase n=1 Tax=Usitatibacter palustris TaxID=2732487 RepID=A0A6M4H8W0_9PROT|nr:FAD-binding oxidoreductase [Usitatibacter palustris]QJR16159.1 6-hydroxy-D-nicotine oxidase [Usitatibacter palustris]